MLKREGRLHAPEQPGGRWVYSLVVHEGAQTLMVVGSGETSIDAVASAEARYEYVVLQRAAREVVVADRDVSAERDDYTEEF